MELFKEDGDLLVDYQRMFWYIEVDEYQDINKEQCELIDLLTAGHGNLMAIGDDDQSVYEFRGGSPDFMLNFKDRYPEGNIYFLSTNFRSTASIVELAAGSIENGMLRLEKKIESAKGTGIPPKIAEDADLKSAVCRACGELLKDGFEPDDICILAAQNLTLGEIMSANNGMLPSHLEKELLCRSAFFTLVKDVLLLGDSLDHTDILREYFWLFRLPVPSTSILERRLLETDSENPYVEPENEVCALKVLKSAKIFLAKKRSVAEFLEYMADISGYKTQPVYTQMVELCELKKVQKIEELMQLTVKMVDSGADIRLIADYPGEILLTTVHESKGREWKAVVIADDFGIKPSPQTKRMIYVAITRAAERLIICKKPGKSLFVK